MRYLTKTIKTIIFTFGALFLVMLVLAFTSVPFGAHYRLGQNPNGEIQLTHPQYVVMFGGAGMPSEDNLMRLYHTAALARHFEIPVVLVHPKDSRHPKLVQSQCIVVTSPEHVRRTVKCLNKVGFQNVIGKAAYPATVDFDLSLKKQNLGGNEAIPSVESVKMRYTFFNYLKLEITCLREYCALAYYWVKGWI